MPRERIHHGEMHVITKTIATDSRLTEVDGTAVITGYERTPYSGGPTGPGQEVHTDPSLDVSWNADGGWVQVSIEIERSQWISNADDFRADESLSARAVYTDVLNRHELNNMIRVLRRARDKAYGADE